MRSQLLGHKDHINLFAVQAIPFVGAFIVSPVLAVASAIRMLVGGIFALAGKIQQAFTGKESNLHKAGMTHLKGGALNFAYSLANIATLGIFGGTFWVGYHVWELGKAAAGR